MPSLLTGRAVWLGFVWLGLAWPACAGTWEVTEDPADSANLKSVFFVTEQFGCAVGEYGGVPIYTTDGGWNWQRGAADVDLSKYNIHGVWFISERVGWVSGQMHPGGRGRAILLRTDDGARTWKRVALPRAVTSAHAVWFDSKGNGWLVPWGGCLIWKTHDHGTTWQTVSLRKAHPEINANPNAFMHPGFLAFDHEHVVLAGTRGLVVWTRDRGKTWQSALAAPSMRDANKCLYAVHFADERHGCVVGANGTIARTRDAGRTWTEVASGVPNGLNAVFMVSPLEGWAAGAAIYKMGAVSTRPGVLLHTTDGATTWRNVSPVTSSLRGLHFLDPDHGWAVGGKGGSASEPKTMILIHRSR